MNRHSFARAALAMSLALGWVTSAAAGEPPRIRAISASTPPATRAQTPGQLIPYRGTGQQIRAVSATRDQMLVAVSANAPSMITTRRVLPAGGATPTQPDQAALVAQLTQRLDSLQAQLDDPDALPPVSARPVRTLLPYPLGQDSVPALRSSRTRYNLDAYNAQISNSARAHGVDPALVRAVIHAESSFNQRAMSPVGAGGLMQLMPATARRFGVSDRFDAAQNIDGGTQYLAWLLQRYNGDVALAAAAYNAGEGAVDRYGGIPPYRETRGYVLKVTRLFQNYSLAMGGNWTNPLGLPDAYGPSYARGVRMISTSLTQ